MASKKAPALDLEQFRPKAAEPPDAELEQFRPTARVLEPAAAPKPSPTLGERITGVLRGGLQGVTGRLSDELVGAGAATGEQYDNTGTPNFDDPALGRRGEVYVEQRDAERGRNAEAKAKAPTEYGVADTVGNVGLSVALPAAGPIATAIGSSDADLTKGEVGQAAKDYAVGLGEAAFNKGAGALARKAVGAVGGKLASKLAPGPAATPLEQSALDLFKTAADTTAKEAKEAAKLAAKSAATKPLSAARAKAEEVAAKEWRKTATKAAADGAKEAGSSGGSSVLKAAAAGVATDYALSQVTDKLKGLPVGSVAALLFTAAKSSPGSGKALGEFIKAVRASGTDQKVATALFEKLPAAVQSLVHSAVENLGDKRTPPP